MKPKVEAFTLVEAVIALGIFSLLLGLGLAIRPQAHRQTVSQFEGQFASLYQRARLEAQSQQKKVALSFQEDGLAALGEKVLYPDNYRLLTVKDWFVQPTGYVAPDHVTWQNGSKKYRLIMQLGGGAYRFKT
ncbi:hypothetical protein FPFC_013570 [Fructobacillus pseudoficulneus]|uniref:Prepilin-type N-terminal cleavage/methylation domain-containing protein n=1 Tax=Fructobacillus pseudoficulneus TaxID=220714 RepID=A0A3F3GS80_9LACO|nr:type II secretion system protein [Fructobacillus pseudoficulneus]GAP02474.1 hypothetical protein FPFC_013570 [Fructobacillus pseudoficulneus]SEH37131.1 competence protein ComGD [Fructobacillus pseudoficulneus]